MVTSTIGNMRAALWAKEEKDEENHSHEAEPGAGQKHDPLKEFVHAHDGEEAASLYNIKRG